MLARNIRFRPPPYVDLPIFLLPSRHVEKVVIPLLLIEIPTPSVALGIKPNFIGPETVTSISVVPSVLDLVTVPVKVNTPILVVVVVLSFTSLDVLLPTVGHFHSGGDVFIRLLFVGQDHSGIAQVIL